MATLVGFADAAGGYIQSRNTTFVSAAADYAQARAGGTLQVNAIGAASALAGQRVFIGYTEVHEAFLAFDTSAIPPTAIITSVALSLYVIGGTAGLVFNARLYDWGAALEAGDFIPGANLAALPLVGHFTSDGVAGYRDLVDDGLAARLNRSGMTRVVLCSALVEAGVVPPASPAQTVTFADTETSGTTQDPRLTVVYEVPSAITGVAASSFASAIAATGVVGMDLEGYQRFIRPTEIMLADAFAPISGGTHGDAMPLPRKHSGT